jgi:hypothetical protein
MSGVIDNKGQQWEHCDGCYEFKRFPQDLGHEKPTDKWQYGRMLCVKCVDRGIKAGETLFENVIPASSWEVVEVDAEY